jgi:hypothetical protein
MRSSAEAITRISQRRAIKSLGGHLQKRAVYLARERKIEGPGGDVITTVRKLRPSRKSMASFLG